MNIQRIILIIFFINIASFFTTFLSYSKEDVNNDKFIGKRKLSLQKRISAENRYEKLLCKFIAVKKDQDLFRNDIFYIENGYYDYGYVFKFKNKKCGEVKNSYWVFVYPKWYVWKYEKN